MKYEIGSLLPLYLWAFLVVCLINAGCWKYSTSAQAIPSGIKTVAVPLFEDTSVETGIKEQLTDAIVSRFIANNQLRVVDVRDADALIAGVILNVREESLTFGQGQSAREGRIWITVQVRFEDVRNRKVIWEEPRMEVFGVYAIQTGTQEEREPGITAAIAKMAEDILNKTVAGW
ncbi:MAG: LptE family protein [candidate division Zixibacteria bacterium]|nr:LptE family protein [candidate division Zixibacteria bacterium]